jgi:hypothetical protein
MFRSSNASVTMAFSSAITADPERVRLLRVAHA